jgi:hypothetical protein
MAAKKGKKIKVQDLKPKKDAKGGFLNTPGGNNPGNHNPTPHGPRQHGPHGPHGPH